MTWNRLQFFFTAKKFDLETFSNCFFFWSKHIFFALCPYDQPVLHTVPVLGEPNPPTRASDSANHASAHGTNCFENFLKSEKQLYAEKKVYLF